MPIASHSSSVGFNPNHSFTSRYILRFLSGLDFPFTPQCILQVFVGAILYEIFSSTQVAASIP